MSDLFNDMQRVGELKRARLDGRPSDRQLAKKANVAPDTVGRWLRGEQFPQKPELLITVLRHIRAEASRRGSILPTPVDDNSDETVADLLDERRWWNSHRAEQERRSQSARDAAERQQAQAALEQEGRKEKLAALLDRPRLVRSWTPQRLGVHPAIPGRPRRHDRDRFVLPDYVPRPHDTELRECLSAAAGEQTPPVLLVLRGGSCTGKTRTAYEAIRETVPHDFQLLFPADADSLQAALDADALHPRTVLWLDDAQEYLRGAAGRTIAASLLRRLDSDGPLIIIATLWPSFDDQLTAAPERPLIEDMYRPVRALLGQAQRIYLPDTFTGALDAVRAAAAHDPSLAAVVEVGTLEVTQTLAAGPELVRRYEHPAGKEGIYGRALISVAMDAHRLGATGPLPLAFLEAAAPGYLHESQRAAASPDWFAGALTDARYLVKDVSAPLQDVPYPSGMGAMPGVVRLADYLQQHGRRTRWELCPPAAFWDASEHLTDPIGIADLADAAAVRCRYRHAAALYCAAIDAGDAASLAGLSWLRELAGEHDKAMELARLAAEAVMSWSSDDFIHAFSFHPLIALALSWEGAGDHEKAEQLAQQAANIGYTGGVHELVLKRAFAGDIEKAEQLAQKIVNPSTLDYQIWMSTLRVTAEGISDSQADGIDESDSQADEIDHSDALVKRARSQETVKARQLFRRAIDAGSSLITLSEVVSAYPHVREDRLLRYGLEADGSPAQSWPWPWPTSIPAKSGPGSLAGTPREG
ncbi:sel1 repeat family protein [Streptomyces ossamyceticus]|uniref:sel1 repeat family protein n=1 Tax=Streptomyces ossamyceticus TaxID=249581 RepID=UPI0036E499FB